MFTVPVKCTGIEEYEDCYFVHLTEVSTWECSRVTGMKNNEVTPLYITKSEWANQNFKVGNEYLLAIASKV